jgi:hypothetical protein
MKSQTLNFVVCLTLGLAGTSRGQLITIEPDNYTNGTILNRIVPQLSLITAGSDNLPIPPVSFDITATDDPLLYTSTGTRVFGHQGNYSMNDIRRLRLDFAGLVSSLSLDFIGSGFPLLPERGHLEVYSAGNVLLDSFVTPAPGAGGVVTMSLNHPAPDIAWAVAWSEGLTYGRLDHLVFSQPVLVPEPSSMALVAVGGCVLGVLRWHRRSRRRA